MEFVFAYAAGLLTLINPCVVPVLPIVLATALQAGRLGPVFLAAGMGLSFVVLGILVTAFGRSFGLSPDTVSNAGAVLMVIFGIALLLPQAGAMLAGATQGLSTQADAELDRIDRSDMRGQFLGGLLLGAVWSPCIGPTLGAAIALASQGEALGRVALTMVAFALGVATLILGLSYGTRGLIGRWNAQLRSIARYARPIMGVTFVVVGTAILFKLHYVIEGWLLTIMPGWLIDLSVSI